MSPTPAPAIGVILVPLLLTFNMQLAAELRLPAKKYPLPL